jgi:hypothetical protein
MPRTLRDFVDQTVRELGVCTLAQVADAASKAGATRARNPHDVVRAALGHSEVAIPLPDGRWTCAARILDDTILTHRLRAAPRGRCDLWPRDDLFPFLPLIGHGVPLASGGMLRPAELSRSRSPVLVGPEGWLPEVAAGDLVGFRWRAGTMQVEQIDTEPDDVSTRVADLRDAFTYHRDASTVYNWRTPLASALVSTLLEAPGLLNSPVPPLGEILSDLIRPAPLPRRLPGRCCCRRADESELSDEYALAWDEDPVVRPLFVP